MFNYDNFEFRYDPFPFAHKQGIVSADMYKEMVQNFPPLDFYNKKVDKRGILKFYLNEGKTKDRYEAFLESKPIWKETHKYIKSKKFLDDVFGLLQRNKINMGYNAPQLSIARRLRQALGDVVKRGRLPEFPKGYYARFEFSILPADGGALLPHTDQHQKLITLVIYLPEEGEWDQSWGGGLELSRPKDMTENFNWMNKKYLFEAVDEIVTFPYVPNSSTLFVKTFNSHHCVRPMTGKGTRALRKTLTINIETN